jgi:hypothetical protein
MFFFEKKNQKTFGHWRTPPERLSSTCKSFLLLPFFSSRNMHVNPKTWCINHRRRLIVRRTIHNGRRGIIASVVVSVMPVVVNRMAMPMVMVVAVVIAAVMVGEG